MELTVGYSYSRDAKTAVEETVVNFNNPETIIYFAPDELFDEFTAELYSRFENCNVIGATTNVSFFPGRAFCGHEYEAGIVVVGMGRGYECMTGVIDDVKYRPITYVEYIRDKMKQMKSTENTICLEFTTAFCEGEELVLDTLTTALEDTGITVVGSSCGNESWKHCTKVSVNGHVYSEACAFMFLRNKLGKIAIYKENIFRPTKHVFTVTSVDVNNRIIHELDHKPAAEVIADALNMDIDILSDEWHNHPIGRIEGDDINITGILTRTGDNGVVALSSVFGGTKIVLMEIDDYKNCMTDFMARVRKEMPQPTFILFVVCVTHVRHYRSENWLPVFCAGLDAAAENYMGISGFGEQIENTNLTNTMMAIVFE